MNGKGSTALIFLALGFLAVGGVGFLGWSKYWQVQDQITDLKKEAETESDRAATLTDKAEKARKAAQDEIDRVKKELTEARQAEQQVREAEQQARKEAQAALARAEKALADLRGAKKPAARIAVVLGGSGINYFDTMKRGAERAAAELVKQGINVEVTADAPAQPNPAEQVKLVEQKLPGVQGLVLTPLGDKELAAPVEKATKGGVPVVLIDRGIPGAESQSGHSANSGAERGRCWRGRADHHRSRQEHSIVKGITGSENLPCRRLRTIPGRNPRSPPRFA